MPIRREYVAGLYRDLLGREGSEGEIEGHLNNPGGEEGLRQFFLGSPEYTSQHGGQASWTDVGGTVTPTATAAPPPSTTAPPPSSSAGSTPPPSAPYRGFTPKHDYSAFDTQREQNPGRSAKDAFAMLSNMAPAPPFHDKAAMTAWFNQYIRPGMDALGHRVTSTTDEGFTYTNHEGTFFVDFGQNLGAAPGSMTQRLQWLSTPVGGSGGGGMGGTGGGSGSARTLQNIGNLYSQLGQQYGGPGGPGVFNGPLQQVGQDPLSQLITGGLADLILGQGLTGSGSDVMRTLQSLIESGGQLPTDTGARQARFERARELMAKGERTALTDARAALADRGLLSEPGSPSGAEASTIGRIQTRNAEEFAGALRDIGIADDDAANTRLTTALGLATGMATDQARTLLSTLGAGSDRQNMLAQIALESLSQNMAWNQFLATFGLERDKAMYAIQNGQIDQILPYLSLFLQLSQSTQRGYI